MDDIYVGRLMTSRPITVGPDTFVEDAADRMLSNEIGSLPVTDETGRLVGMLTTTDFVAIVAASKPKANTTVERYMSTDLVTVSAQTPIREAADAMVEHGVHHLPVVDDENTLVGVVSTADLTDYLSGLAEL